MTQQDIVNNISASYHSLEICHTILSHSMDELINGQFNNEPYLFPVAGSEDDVRFMLNTNRLALEGLIIEEWYENNVEDEKINEINHIISASKSFNSII